MLATTVRFSLSSVFLYGRDGAIITPGILVFEAGKGKMGIPAPM
jgi:hypothetical protein